MSSYSWHQLMIIVGNAVTVVMLTVDACDHVDNGIGDVDRGARSCWGGSGNGVYVYIGCVKSTPDLRICF